MVTVDSLQVEPGETPEYIDKTVTPKKEYQYRVSGVNEGGVSEPSDESDLIKARPLKGMDC